MYDEIGIDREIRQLVLGRLLNYSGIDMGDYIIRRGYSKSKFPRKLDISVWVKKNKELPHSDGNVGNFRQFTITISERRV